MLRRVKVLDHGVLGVQNRNTVTSCNEHVFVADLLRATPTRLCLLLSRNKVTRSVLL